MDTRDLAIAGLEKLFSSAPSNGLTGDYGFVFSDAAAGEQLPVVVEVRQDGVVVRRTETARGAIIVKMAMEDFVQIMAGKASAGDLFAAGKVEISGDNSLLMGIVGLLGLVPVKPKKHPIVERPSDVLSASQDRITSIERLKTIEPQAFHDEYVSRGIPVVLTEISRDWPIITLGHDAVSRRLADAPGMVRRAKSLAYDSEAALQPATFGQFYKEIENLPSNTPGPLPYMIKNTAPEFIRELIPLPKLFPPTLFGIPYLWFGPQGTVSSLHRDNSDNLFLQVWGRKRFRFFAPRDWKFLYAHSQGPTQYSVQDSDVDAENLDLERFPLCAEARMLVVDLDPGDLLFLPEGWFHHVRSLSLSLSVNFWVTSRRT